MSVVLTLFVFACGAITGAHAMSVRYQITETKRLVDKATRAANLDVAGGRPVGGGA